MGKAIGCGAIALIVAVIMVIGGFFLVKQGGENARAAQVVAGLSPALALDVERGAPGQRFIVLGQIDPDAPLAEASKGLVMYERERYEVSRGSKGRTTRSWKSAGSATPPFRLLTEDGWVEIVSSDYELELPRFEEPGRASDNALRYKGFRPGDSVLVDGVAEGDGLAAMGWPPARSSAATRMRISPC
jgi:hypothetical protein